MKKGMRVALTIFLLAVVAVSDAVADQLTIKGLTLGDTPDKISLLGVSDVCLQGTCFGKTTYGSAPASFIVDMKAGRVVNILVTFAPARSAEVLAGLTARYGPPNGPSGCKPEAKCSDWNSDGLRLTLFEDVGSVMLSRASPSDGY